MNWPAETSNLNPKVDVIIPVFNSERFLQRCVKSIYRELSVNRLIVVDSWSSDNTLKIVRGFPRTEIHQCTNNLAKKRELGINLVETELYCFIDSDIELLPGFSVLSNLFKNSKLGAVYAHPLNPHILDFQFYSNLATNKLAEKLEIKNKFRPFGPCFIRNEATIGIKIPSIFDMNYEDYYIAQYIRHKGFEIININDRVLALHHVVKRSTRRKPAHSVVYYERESGRRIIRRRFWKLALSIPKGLYAFNLYPHPGVIFWEFKNNLRHFSHLLRILRDQINDAL